jgi:hypothetical protein
MRINWISGADLTMLSMMQQFTDKELENLGMGPQDIIKYRAYKKRNEEKVTVRPLLRKESDH